jgi:DNA-binding NtrC family response regulator
LIGETGAGKLTLARIIQSQGQGQRSAFAILDCSALPPDLQREQLHGRFDRPSSGEAGSLGIFARKGPFTLIIRHPFALALELQRELESEFSAIDSGRRLIVTERQRLELGLSDGRLVESFYYFISPLQIVLPPLRDRTAELEDHCAWLLSRLAAKRQLPPPAIDPAALQLLSEYDWPGNLRELETVLANALDRITGNTLLSNDLPRRLKRRTGDSDGRPVMETATPANQLSNQPPPLDKLLEEVERRMLRLASQRFRGNKSNASADLGISRARFIRRWEQLGLDPGENLSS